MLRLARGAPASTAALTSDNPSGPTFDVDPDTVVIAKLERAISPESLAPPTGTVIADDDLATRFGLHELHPKTGRRAGHHFLFIDTKGVLESPDRLRLTGLPTPWPGETGFALARESDTTWRYLGVARTTESANVWSIPEVDFRTWRRWGTGRSVSRALPEGALARAQEVVDHLLALPESERTLTTHDGKTARLLGPAEKGGLRIDGGQGGFSARTISLTDLAWIAVAHDDVLKLGGTLDEPRVNRVRYLEGTPKESTRWIDSAWAIAAWGDRASRELGLGNCQGVIEAFRPRRASRQRFRSSSVPGVRSSPLDPTQPE